MINKIKEFQRQNIRVAWDNNNDEWLFSIIDIILVLTESKNPQVYWRVLKKRLKEEGNETVTKCNALKMPAQDGKKRLTDVGNMEQILRIIQSIPSKKTEPFKLWLAKVGKERIDEIVDPEISIDRALTTYQKKGYDKDWIHQRMMSIRVRNELTDEWKNRGIQENNEYAILTDEIIKTWSGMTTKGYKQLKKLRKENLRDNMTTTELILTMLAETATKDISQVEKPKGIDENLKVASKGGKVAKTARAALEKETHKSVISKENAKNIGSLISDIITDLSIINKD